MTDTERIDALERHLWNGSVGNGIAIFPCTENKTGRRLVSLTDLGDEDGSNLGQELTETVPTLREAIDLAVSANAAGQGCEAYPAPACSQMQQDKESGS